MTDLSCWNCNYTPGKYPEDIGEFLEADGLEDDFIRVSYGPEKDGTSLICPLCGVSAGRDEPEHTMFMKEDSEEMPVKMPEGFEDTTVEIPSWTGKPLPHTTPDEVDPQLCPECRDLIMPSDRHYIEGGEWICSDECLQTYKENQE